MAKKFSQSSYYGLPSPIGTIFPSPLVAQRDPIASDTAHPLGQLWVNSLTNAVYVLSANVAGAATWLLLGGGLVSTGTGAPTAAASAGSLYLRTNGGNNDRVLYVNYDGGATHWVPVIDLSSTLISPISQSPILQSILTTGAAPSGATGDVNLMCMQGGDIMQQFIIGAGQTIIAPRMDTNGLLVSLDLTATEGAEYNWGMTANSKHAYTIGTSPAFNFTMRYRVADVTGAEPVSIGFRKQEANQATYTTYTDYAMIGLNNAVNPATIIIEDRLNSGVAVQTNTTDAWVDGGTHTLSITVSSAGVVSYTIDGVAPTATHAFTFDNGDVVSPFFHFVHGAAAPGAIEWVSMSCGLV